VKNYTLILQSHILAWYIFGIFTVCSDVTLLWCCEISKQQHCFCFCLFDLRFHGNSRSDWCPGRSLGDWCNVSYRAGALPVTQLRASEHCANELCPTSVTPNWAATWSVTVLCIKSRRPSRNNGIWLLMNRRWMMNIILFTAITADTRSLHNVGWIEWFVVSGFFVV